MARQEKMEGREGRTIGDRREKERGRDRGEAGCDATTHNDDSLVDCIRCSRKTRREEETSRQDIDEEERLQVAKEKEKRLETEKRTGKERREKIEMEEREITELANIKIAWRWYSRVI